jgi:hypothetical protein
MLPAARENLGVREFRQCRVLAIQPNPDRFNLSIRSAPLLV